MIFAEKISNVKLKKDYTELLFFVDENDNEEGYNPGTICALRIDHESEIFNMTDNKNLIVSELLKIQTLKTIPELVKFMNEKGYIYSITKLSAGRNPYAGLINNDDLKVNVGSVYADFSDDDIIDEVLNYENDRVDNSMYERSKSLEGYMEEKFSEPHPDEDELCLDIYSRYKDYEKYMN